MITCKSLSRYLISTTLIFHPSPQKLKNVTYFSFLDVHAWLYLYLFVSASRENKIILSAPPLIFDPSPPKLKNVTSFSFFDVHAWHCLFLFRLTPHMCAVSAPFTLLLFSFNPSYSASVCSSLKSYAAHRPAQPIASSVAFVISPLFLIDRPPALAHHLRPLSYGYC